MGKQIFDVLESRLLFSAYFAVKRHFEPAALSHATATLVEPRGALAGTAVGHKALFAGGLDKFSRSPVVDVYDTQTGSWAQSHLSQARFGLSAASVGSLAFFAGGSGSDIVDIFDNSTGTWSTTHLSQARDEPAAVGLTGHALFLGNASPDDLSSTADVFDVASGTWRTEAIPFPIRSQTALPTPGIAAGHLALFPSARDAAGHNVMDVYDESVDQWSTVSFPSNALPLGVGVGNQAVFAGTDGAYVFNADSREWRKVDLPRGYSFAGLVGATATSVGTKAIFAGGYTGNFQLRDQVLVFDLTTGNWTQTRLVKARFAAAAASVDGKAIVAGGEEGLSESVDTVDLYGSPAPAVTGNLKFSAQPKLTLTIRNSGDAPLPAGTEVVLFASGNPGVITRESLRLSSVTLRKSLHAGASAEVELAADASKLPPSRYYFAVHLSGPGQERGTVLASMPGAVIVARRVADPTPHGALLGKRTSPFAF